MRFRTLLVLGAVVVAAAVVLARIVTSEDDLSLPDVSESAVSGGPGFASSIDEPGAVVWAVGDGGVDEPPAERVARLITKGGVERLLYLGDVYGEEGGTLADFEANYEPSYGAMAAVTAPTPGNHEAQLADEGYDPYWESALGQEPPPYYAFTVSGWEILSLNSQIDHGRGTPQMRWLRRQVATGGDCRIAFWHRPRFSASEHGDQPDVAPLWNALKDRARIVLGGHDHDMQRFRPQAGITQFVSGAGGASLYPVDSSDSRLEFSNDSDYGALRLDLSPGRAEYSFVDVAGEVLDEGSISCSA